MRAEQECTVPQGLTAGAGRASDAKVPEYHSNTGRKRLGGEIGNLTRAHVECATPAGRTQGKVALFATCYGNYNEPHILEDLVKVFQHNDYSGHAARQGAVLRHAQAGAGDLEAVAAAKEVNVPEMIAMIEQADIVGPVPSCVLMFTGIAADVPG
ncbi:MAG: hypothetical protein R3E95_16615 [Thiolinea sp.]